MKRFCRFFAQPPSEYKSRVLTAFLALCFSLVLAESNLPSQQARQQLPGCILLAALPHRRVAGERSATAPTITETVCSNTIDGPTAGFTLIELSIVLVIIGLIVGGVLVGQDLLRASAVRAQISQIQSYQAAVTTFQANMARCRETFPQLRFYNWVFLPLQTEQEH